MPTGTYVRTEYHRKAISKGSWGKVVSQETRSKLSVALKGNQNGIGNKSRIGMKNSAETRRKIALGNTGKKHPHTEETKIKLSKLAIEKGTIPPSRKGIKATLETRQKLSELRKGDKCNLWKGGITPKNALIRTSFKYKLWREAVFERDNYTCIMCYARSEKGKAVVLNADHIKPFAYYPELRFDINNGRTLCKNCHKKTDTYGNKRQHV